MAGVMRSYRVIAVLTAVISGLVTIAFARLPQFRLGYAWPAARLALETSGSLIALFAAFLVFGRLRRRTYLNELLLACVLAVLALSNPLFVTVPTVAGEAPDDLTVWAGEAITNAAKHSGAGQVTLRLERDGSLVRMQVADRGCGFDTSVPGGGFGLVSMRERIRSVGGELHIRSGPGRGSEVEVAV
jgi:hypothetical protein